MRSDNNSASISSVDLEEEMIDLLDAPENMLEIDVAEAFERAEYAKYPKLCFRCTCEYGREHANPAVIMLGNEWLCGRHAMERVNG